MVAQNSGMWTVRVSTCLKKRQGVYPDLSLIYIYLGEFDMEKAMAPHSSTLAWEIPWTEELGRLQSMGSRRVGHNWANALSLFSFMHWRGKWQPSAVFLPGEYQGQGSLVGCCLWSSTELDMTEVTWQQQQQQQESFEASCGHCGGREC